MDSLHPSLSQALPLRGYDAEQVLQAPFRAAALGIATFYKKAAENGRKGKPLGSLTCLTSLLSQSFLIWLAMQVFISFPIMILFS